MTFIRPDLLAVAPVAVLLLALGVTLQWRRELRLVRAFGGTHAARHLIGRDFGRYPATRLACLTVAAITLTAGAAGPEREEGQMPAPRTPVDLVIAIDVSRSMSATDVDGGRIGRARELLARLTDVIPFDRMGLSLFADWPYRLVPLTYDPNIVRFFGPFVTTDLMAQRDRGTSIAAAVSHAYQTLAARKRPGSRPIILLVTDGEAHGDDDAILDSIRSTAARGATVWIAGVGTGPGAPLLTSAGALSPGVGTPFLDGAGNQVISGYEEDLLRTMAEAGNGNFYDISGNAGMRSLMTDLRDVSGIRETGGTGRSAPIPWLLFIALPLLLWDAIADSGRFARRTVRRRPDSA